MARSDQPRIYLWDENAISYYEDLESKVGRYARNSLLGELDIQSPNASMIRVLAFQMASSKHNIGADTFAYTFLIDPQALLEVSYVARREVRGESFYQRLLKKEKIRSIGRFVDDGNMIPNNIIVAFGDAIKNRVKFEPLRLLLDHGTHDDPTFGVLEFPREYRALWIIDGQHRLFGFSQSDTKANILVTAFQNLPLPQQAKMFVDINKNQSPVKPDLVWDLEGELTPEMDRGVISRVVKLLAELPPLSGKVYVPSKGMKQPGQLTLAGLCTALEKVGLHKQVLRSSVANPWFVEDTTQRVVQIGTGLAGFLKAFKEDLSDEWFGGRERGLATFDGGIALIIRLAERIVGRISMKQSSQITQEDFDPFLRVLDRILHEDFQTDIDRKELRSRLSSEGGREEVAKDLCLKIRELLGDTDFCIDLVRAWEARFFPIQGKLRKLVKERMSEAWGPGWFDSRIEEKMRGESAARLQADPDSAFRLPEDFLSLGNCFDLIRRNFETFEGDLLIASGASWGFHSQREVEAGFDHITRMDNRFSIHSTLRRASRQDEKQLEVLLNQLDKIL